MTMKYNFLCIDIGTSSLKAALVSEKGQVLSFSRVSFNSTQKDKIAAQWILALKKAVLELNDRKNSLFECDAICISGNGPTIVSEDGTTLLWNADISLKKSIPEKYSRSLFLPRIIAFGEMYSEKFSNQKIFSGPEFLIYQLCNNQITILPESRYETAYWTDEAISLAGGNPENFGPFVNPGFNCGPVSERASTLFNIKKDIPVIAGGPDFTVAMIGTNTLTPGKLCDCAGSSEGINLCTDKAVFKEGIRTLPSVIPGLWNAAVLKQSSGTLFAQCKKDYEKEINRPISYVEYIKYCFSNPDSSGYKTMKDLSEFVRDGIAILKNFAQENNFPFCDTIMITGGQTNHREWMQLKTDVAGHKFCVTEVPDSELIGDAVLCAFSLGLYSSIQEAAENIVVPRETYSPRNITE